MSHDTPQQNRTQQEGTRTGSPQFNPSVILSSEILSNLIHKIGHEIGNPLTAIISLATIIERFNDESAVQDLAASLKKISGYSTSIIDEAWKISALSERLVMLLSSKPGNPAPCDVADTFRRTARKLSARGRIRKLELAINQIGAVPAVAYIDADQFIIVLQELFSNATHAAIYSAPGSAERVIPPLTVLIKGEAETSYFAISNAAAAAAAVEPSALFEPFVTTWADKKHLGLGLTVCWAVVHRFGGSMQIVEERSGAGYTFTVAITLPAKGK